MSELVYQSLFPDFSFPIGCAVNIDLLDNDTGYKEIITQSFSSITPEFHLKTDILHPSEFSFDFTNADRLAGYCEYHKKRLHGHTLIWHEALPHWILKFEGEKKDWEELFKKHIQTVVSYFKGRVRTWDVVNEAFNEDGSLRETIWKRNIGEDYIEKAFSYAREADDNALLFYNDYNLESNEVKRKAVLKHLDQLRKQNVKVDGIGLQMHIYNDFKIAFLPDALREIGTENYQIHLSELEIYLRNWDKKITVQKNPLLTQINLLRAIVSVYKNEVIPCLQYGITFWDLTLGSRLQEVNLIITKS